MDKSKPPSEPDEVTEFELDSMILYPLIQTVRRVMTGIAGGMAFYWLQAEPGVWEVITNMSVIIIILGFAEIFLMPIARDFRP